jgi:hypothetical protein
VCYFNFLLVFFFFLNPLPLECDQLKIALVHPVLFFFFCRPFFLVIWKGKREGEEGEKGVLNPLPPLPPPFSLPNPPILFALLSAPKTAPTLFFGVQIGSMG